uniref:Uncharacterized protein n=1 Tax=Megaselia scalaris TaxID=36166 RepID=T1GSF6_MEGSC
MAINSSSEIYEAFNVVRFFVLSSGLFLCSRSSSGTISNSKLSIIILFFFYILYLISFGITFKDTLEFMETFFNSEMAMKTILFYPLANIFYVTAIFLTTFVNRGKMVRLIALIVNLDKCGLRIHYKKVVVFSSYFVVFITLYFVLYFLYDLFVTKWPYCRNWPIEFRSTTLGVIH